MRITKCYISSFGKLNDVTFDFNDGVNTILADNGWGKSTLSYFIKAMFYGFKGEKKGNIFENERERFTPWGSQAKFGGYIEFIWGDKSFKIERFFGQKSSEDTLKLIDLKTGKEFDDKKNLDSIGSRIFDIDEDGFFLTTYYSQEKIVDKQSSSLKSKYNSLCAENDDANAFKKAIKSLDEGIHKYYIRGNKGLLTDIKKEIVDIEEKLNQAKSSESSYYSLKDSISVLEKDIVKLSDKAKELREKLDKVGKIEAIKVKQDSYTCFVKQKNNLLLSKKDNLFILNNCDIKLNDILIIEEKINQINSLIKDIDEMEKKILESSSKNQTLSNSGKLNFVFLALMLVCGFISVLCVFITQILGYLPLIVFCILFVLSLLAFILLKKKTKDNINCCSSNNGGTFTEKRALLSQNETIVNNFLSRFNVDKSNYFLALSKIRSAFDQVKNVDSQIAEIDKNLLLLSSDPDLKIDISNAKFDKSLQEEFDKISQIIDEKKDAVASTREKIARIENEISCISDLEERKDELIEYLAVSEKKFNLLSKTHELLEIADENLRSKYRLPLEQSFNKYLKLISGIDIIAEINVDMQVSILEKGERKDIAYYSKGYQDLFDLCKRFALIDVLFTKEKPFMILDDPFYNLDEKKISFATELIKKLSKEYQIIYLTCHESRKI